MKKPQAQSEFLRLAAVLGVCISWTTKTDHTFRVIWPNPTAIKDLLIVRVFAPGTAADHAIATTDHILSMGSTTAFPACAILAAEGGSMIDPVQIPILIKAIDFVFEEGRKILEERRERRKSNESSSKSEAAEPEVENPPIVEQKPVEMKQDLLASKIEDGLWQNHEQEVQHLVRLLETYSRNYHLAQEQYAKWGSALVPPIITHNLTEAENSMINTIKQLEVVLSKVYKKDIQPVK